MLIMLSVFGVLFFMDGMWGYREKNLHFYVHQSFISAGKEFQRLQGNDGFTESSWKEFAAKQRVSFPEDAIDVIPKEIDSDMIRIDKRKWDVKGLALVYYKDGSEEKKAKIDGMVYGQFKEENGAPAEKLFSKVMEHFKGEVVEYASVDEDEESELEDSEDQA